jgi:transglutaminase-like putative cysteine protease
MLFKGSHLIRYSYSLPVFLEPHVLRLRPRNDTSQQIREFSMRVEPPPAGTHDFLDAEGNLATSVWFEGKIEAMTVSSTFEVRTLCANPFGFLVTENAFCQLPSRYTGSDANALAPFLGTAEPESEIKAFVQHLVEKAAGNSLDFLVLLNTAIYENFTVEIRDDGPPLPPVLTMERKQGSCRDFAVLFIAACRSVGLAARFVSGYQEGDPDMVQRHLHAWAEVYIPGAGWRGYDPTHGLAVADRHIVLAASYHSSGAAPTSGTFRGTGSTALMDYAIDLRSFPE